MLVRWPNFYKPVSAQAGQLHGKQRAGRIVDVRVLENLLEVWDGPELIKNVLRTSKGEVRKKKAERH